MEKPDNPVLSGKPTAIQRSTQGQTDGISLTTIERHGGRENPARNGK